MADDILQPISSENFPKLLEVLHKNDKPHSSGVYNFLVTQSRWASQIPDMQLQVLCPHGDWTSGTVVALSIGLALDDNIFGAIYTLEESGEKLKEALIKTRRIPWDKFSHFTGVLQKHYDVAATALSTMGLTVRTLIPHHMHFMTAEDTEQITIPECPEGVHVGSLDASHLDVLCDNWPHYNPEYRPVVFNMIDKNPSTGVFVDGQLAAMVCQSEYGGVGLLQTVPNFRRRGLASIALAHQVRKMGQAGINLIFHVLVDNSHALDLFKNMGFKIIERTQWLMLTR